MPKVISSAADIPTVLKNNIPCNMPKIAENR